MRYSNYKFPILILLLCVTSPVCAPTFAAPIQKTQEVRAAKIEPAAAKLLNQAAAAYQALDSHTLKFSVTEIRDGKEQTKEAQDGILLIQNPDKARLEINVGNEKAIYVANGNLMNAQAEPTYYVEARDEKGKEDFVYDTVATLNDPLSFLMSGDNMLDPDNGYNWKNVKVVPAQGFDCVSLSEQNEATTYRIYFDPATHLIKRIETESEIDQGPKRPKVISLQTLTLASGNVAITPTIFVYQPPVGARKMTGEGMPVEYNPKLVVGAKPFPLAGKTLENKAISLDDYAGKVVLLDFWATWCGPCLEEMPNMNANYAKYHAQGFEIIGISLDIDEAALRNFVKKRELKWPQIFDGKVWDSPDARTYGMSGIPFTLLIGKDGTIAAIEPRGSALAPAIEAALAK